MKKKASGNLTRTKKLAASAILSALSVVLMYLACMTSLDLTLVVASSFAVVFAVIEFGGKYPFLIYAVTGALALAVVPNKSTALIYVMIVGYYPMAKAAFERKHYVVAWLLKLSLFNTAMLLTILMAKYILHLPDTGLGFDVITVLLGNAAFVLYDIAASKLILLYFVKLRAKLKIKNYFEE